MPRARNKPQSGRSKGKRNPSPTHQKNVPPIKKKEIPSIALTVPSPGWTEWMQSGIDWVSSWVFPQPQSNMLSDSDFTDTDVIDIDINIANTTEPIPLAQLNGTDGSILYGPKPWANSGVAVAGGDPNRDGKGDVGVCSPFLEAEGAFTLISGSDLQNPTSLADPDAILFSAVGEERGDFFGSAVAMDNESVVVSARYANSGNQSWVGKSYRMAGNATGEVDLSSPEVQQFIGMDAEEQSGSALDVGYRFVDGVMKRLIIITAPFACPQGNCGTLAAGRIYGVYDDPNLPNPFYLADLYGPHKDKGFVIEGIPGQQVGCDAVYIQALDALLFGAGVASPNNKTYAGNGFLLYLNSLFSSSSVFNLADMNETHGNIFYGPHARAKFGTAVDVVYNFFGNGKHALIFGAPGGCPDALRLKAGMAFAVNLACDFPLPYPTDLSNTTVVSQCALQLNGVSAWDNAGIAVSAAGDNILIAAVTGSLARSEQPGLTYVVKSGDFSSFSNPLELASLNGTQGDQYIGGEPDTTMLTDSSCVGATSNVNGNGLVAAIISQYTATPNATLPGAGEIYLVYLLATVSPPSYWTQSFQYLSVIKPEALYRASVKYLSEIDFNSVYEASVSGGLRGTSRVIEEKLGQDYSSIVSKSVSELFYTLSYATFIYWNHYNRAMAEGDERSAAYKAMAETYNDMLIWFATRIFFEGVVAKSFEWAASCARGAGYDRLAGCLSFWGNHASTGVYLSSEIIRKKVPGALNAACTLFGGAFAEKVTKSLVRPLLIEKKLDESTTHAVEYRI